MKKYKTKIKAQINLYKEIEVVAENEIIKQVQKDTTDEKVTYREIKDPYGFIYITTNLLDNCRKVIEENDRDIKRYMSYWNYNKIEEVKYN